ncbi:arylamine N-acetyltransferase [Mycobacterium sp. CBMA271]|uniref:arylamine N-acetyltransferase family protein n=1 Tax=unclassified Mycobacteroides TaxID=2618759 RepID=UPI0012DE2ECC|nr:MULTISPECIES: arylamine N-acetyltransferase [unclassified Mycobacteroides]MUM17122.1 arylamine N-acetyltransferase [Mycobacteroides sp. CBMA 326]MUM23361.1 arylamine N-acetyltransferase [Mycobacteroides sp. CBMA 271]
MWNGDELALDEYLAFIGFDGDRSPSMETLRRLQRGHVLNIKWENLDAVLYKHVALDIPTVQAKLLRGPRGGYCYEHVALFAAALERLGFDFFGIQGRVQMGATAIRPATHGMLVVRLDGEQWLCDVGFGTSPLLPIRLVDEAVVTDESWTYLLRRSEVTPGADGWTLSEAAGDGSQSGWMSRHTFVLEPQYPIDYRAASYFVASSPRSPFSTRVFVQRIMPDRAYILDHRELHDVRAGVGRTTQELTPHEVLISLREIFGIELGPDESTLLLQRLAAQ